MPAVAAACINAALPLLTADDLRNAQAGRGLVAEAWAEATAWERYKAFVRTQDAGGTNSRDGASDDTCPGCDERQARASQLIDYFSGLTDPLTPSESADAAAHYLEDR